MANYSGSGNQTLTTALATCLTLGANATTPNRSRTYDLICGNEGTPADNVCNWKMQRCTALGTSTAVTPTKLDPADRAAQSPCGENHTVEPTYTSAEELIEFPLNTRATFRWVAAPGSEIVIPATASNGWGIGTLHASATTDFRAIALWSE